MSYIVHLSKGNDVELTDSEHETFQECVLKGNIFKIKRSGEMINPAFFINSERLVELPKNDPKAVDNFMERQREAGVFTKEKKPYGARSNAS